MRELFSFIEEKNFLPQAVVESNNIITDQGNAFNDFAVHMARKLGYSCPDIILKGYIDSSKKEDYIHYLPNKEALMEFIKEYKQFI